MIIYESLSSCIRDVFCLLITIYGKSENRDTGKQSSLGSKPARHNVLSFMYILTTASNSLISQC